MTGAAAPRGVLSVGDRVWWDGAEHVVVGLSGTTVRLAGAEGDQLIALSRLQAATDFEVLSGGGPVTLPAFGLLDAVPAAAFERARWWERHVVEVETGLPPDAAPDAVPRPDYDPLRHSLEQRERAKAVELTAQGHPVSRATVRRRRRAYAASGLWGLVDQRATRARSPTGRVDPRVVAATRQALTEQTARSTGTRGRLRRRVEQLLRTDEYGSGGAWLPSTPTFYRLLSQLDRGHAFAAATTRRSQANRPAGPFGSVQAVRPGQLVQTDTTPLDVMAVLDDGVVGRVELTTLIDLATRTACAAVLRPHGTKAVDAALLLARALVPEPMRPGWPEALRLRTSRLPYRDLAWVDRRLAEAAAKPVIVPETIVCDRGAVFLSETFLAACSRLGISVQPAHPMTPTDKAVVERTFSSINTLFCQYVAGYAGRDVTRRGEHVDGEAVWSIGELQDLLDEWVIACWQVRPHDGLRHPDLPREALSPNEMYAALVAAAGYLPLALSGADYLELLPVEWRQITAEGIRLGYLTYDCPQLNPYRGQPSGVATKSGRWEVHYDPYDLSQVWVRTGAHGASSSDGWIAVPWIHHSRTRAPFADYTLRHVRKLLAGRAQDANQSDLARALDDLLERAETGPARDRTSRRVAARTRAAAANPLRPTADTDEDRDDVASSDVDGADEDIVEVASDDAAATVVPFGVFNAREEAERFW